MPASIGRHRPSSNGTNLNMTDGIIGLFSRNVILKLFFDRLMVVFYILCVIRFRSMAETQNCMVNPAESMDERSKDTLEHFRTLSVVGNKPPRSTGEKRKHLC